MVSKKVSYEGHVFNVFNLQGLMDKIQEIEKDFGFTIIQGELEVKEFNDLRGDFPVQISENLFFLFLFPPKMNWKGLSFI